MEERSFRGIKNGEEELQGNKIVEEGRSFRGISRFRGIKQWRGGASGE